MPPKMVGCILETCSQSQADAEDCDRHALPALPNCYFSKTGSKATIFFSKTGSKG